MKLLVKGVLVLGLVLGVWVCQVAAESGVVAKIGTILVTEQDVQTEIEKRIPMQVTFHGKVKPDRFEKLRAEAKDALIVRAYKIQYALDNKMTVEANVLDGEWAKALVKVPEAATAPEDQQEALKKEILHDLLAKRAEEYAVTSKVVVSDDEVRNYYAANKGQFLRAKLYKASHILVKVDPAENAEQREAKRQRAEKLLARAKAGEDFYNLAYYESDDRSRYVGGTLGSFHVDQITPEFRETLQSMKSGELAGPLRTLYGYHILKVDDVQPEKQLSLEEAAAGIKDRLAGEKRTKLYDEWMGALRRQYPL